MTFRTILLTLCTLLLSYRNVSAQYAVDGTVTDPAGKSLVGVHVWIHETGQGKITDSTGHFKFQSLHGGNYHLHIQTVGYKPIIKEFKLNENIYLGVIPLTPALTELQQIDVEDSKLRAAKMETTLPVIVLDAAFLEQNPGSTLAGVLTKVPGIQALTTGTGIAKPMIRGLGFNRVAVVENGIRQEGQQWGADHGLEIDQFNVKRIELIKGPGSLLYGSDAITGVLHIKPVQMKPNTLEAGILTTYRSNNDLGGGSAWLGIHKKGIQFRARYSTMIYRDYRVPADQFVYNGYVLPIYNNRIKNTAGHENNGSFSLGLFRNRGFTMLTGSLYHLKTGFFPGAHGIPAFNNLLPDNNTGNIDLPYQEVYHGKLIWNSNIRVGKHWLEADVGYQYNRRREYSAPHSHGYEPTPDGNTELSFDLQTVSANIRLHQAEFRKIRMIYGLSAQYKTNRSGGYSFLIPNFTDAGAGFFVYSGYELKKGNVLSGGIRADGAALYSDPVYRMIYANGLPQGIARVSPKINRLFGNVSGSVGYSMKASEYSTLKWNVGSSFRLPTVPELTANGIHHGALRYEQGDSTLTSERSVQFDMEYSYDKNSLHFTVSPFFNYYNGFIFLDPTSKFSPLPDAGLIWKYNQADGIHTGIEYSIDFHPVKGLHLNSGAQFVYTYNLRTGYNFPLIPPAGGHLEAEYEYAFKGSRNTVVSFGTEVRWAAPQMLVARNEKTTPGYAILNVHAGFNIRFGPQTIKLHATVQNILNTRYFNHLSTWRFIGLPEPGRNIILTLSLPLETKI